MILVNIYSKINFIIRRHEILIICHIRIKWLIIYRDLWQKLDIYSWNERKLKQIIDLGDDGIAPLEIRFLHDPLAAEEFVGCAVTSNVYRFYKGEDNLWKVEKVIQVPPKRVEGWIMPLMSGITNRFSSKFSTRSAICEIVNKTRRWTCWQHRFFFFKPSFF